MFPIRALIKFDSIFNISPIFNGRGYLLDLDSSGYESSRFDTIVNTTIYISQDVYQALGFWLCSNLKNLNEKSGWNYEAHQFQVGELAFGWDWNYEYATSEDKKAYIEHTIKSLGILYDDKDMAVWKHPPEGFRMFDSPKTYVRDSFNNPQQGLLVDVDKGQCRYVIERPGEARYPVIALDVMHIRIAERLLNIANTVTYPEGDYDLSLKIAFGELAIEKLTKTQLRELAERLLP